MYRTPAFEAFVAPAREDNQLWRTVVTFAIGTLLYVFWTALVFLIAGGVLAATYGVDEAIGRVYSALEGGLTPFDLGLVLATFIPMAAAAVVMVIFYGRSPMTLFGRRKNFLRNFLFAGGVIAVLHFGLFIYDRYFGANDLTANLPLGQWSLYMLWALPLLFIQITAEELVFRGFLVQQLAARFRSPFWWMVVPSVLFGLLHFDPTIDFWLAALIVLIATFFGIVAVDLTNVTGSLAAAMGLHFANNFFAMMITATPDKLSGLSLYHANYTMQDTEMLMSLIWLSLIMLTAVWLFVRGALR